jgi:diguanylate cyclase (GGDEF)-like protein/PAS domain S-box-containing protein
VRNIEISPETSTLEILQEPFFVLGSKGECLKSNLASLDLVGYPWQELQQRAFLDLVAAEHQERIREGFHEMGQGRPFRLRIHLLHRSGGRIPVDLSGIWTGETFLITLKDLRERIRIAEEYEKAKKDLVEKMRERDQYARELQAMRDLYKEKLKEIEKMREEAVFLSYTDDLTQIYNHRFFINQLTLEVDRQKRYPSPLSLLMIDIDDFKHYNDTNGHLAGDEVLKAIAMLIQYGVRQTDVVARYGGEEFAAILISAGKEGAREIAERVRTMVAETRFLNEAAQPHGDLTVSIGVATYSPSISSVTELIRQADNALYRAKKTGRNRVEA